MPSDYDQICASINRQIATYNMSGDETAMTVLDIVAAAADSIPLVGVANSAAQALYGKLKKKDPIIPNPWFVMNGHEDRSNRYTAKYLKHRDYKGYAGAAISLAGTLASGATAGIDVGSSVMHANATGSTAAHMIKIVAIAKSYRQTKTIQDWCEVVMAAKKAKAAIRGGQLVGGLIPGLSLPASVVAIVAKAAVKLTLTNICFTTAASIHWRAFREQAISGGLELGTGGKTGPASKIYWEIFARRGATRVFGRYDTARLISEPGGWQALADKLLLI